MQGYRQEVIAACEGLPRPFPGLISGRYVEKNAYITEWRTLRDSWHNILGELWRQDVPDSLQADQEKAQMATDRLLDDWGGAIDDLESELKPRLQNPEDILAAAQAVGTATATSTTAWLGAMRRLADGPCAPPDS